MLFTSMTFEYFTRQGALDFVMGASMSVCKKCVKVFLMRGVYKYHRKGFIVNENKVDKLHPRGNGHVFPVSHIGGESVTLLIRYVA